MRFPCALEREKNEHTQMTKGAGNNQSICFSSASKALGRGVAESTEVRLPGSGRLAQPKQISSRNFCDAPEPHTGVNYFRGKADLRGCQP